MAVDHVILQGVPRRPARRPYFTDYLSPLHRRARSSSSSRSGTARSRPGGSCAAARARAHRGRRERRLQVPRLGRPTRRAAHAARHARLPLAARRRAQWNLEMKDGARRRAASSPALTLPRAATTRVARGGLRRLRRRADARAAACRCAGRRDARRARSRSPPSSTSSSPSSASRAASPATTPPATTTRTRAYTPAWQERFTGIDRADVDPLRPRVGDHRREDRRQVLDHHRRRHQPLVPHRPDLPRRHHRADRSRGCVGKNGGGLNHYVGQEKLAPVAPWATLACALDWARPAAPPEHARRFHYVHSDQWRYERTSDERARSTRSPASDPLADGHTMDHQVRAVRLRLAALLPAVRPEPARRW